MLGTVRSTSSSACANTEAKVLFSVAFSPQDLEKFKDPVYYKKFRHDLEADLNVRSTLSLGH